MWSTMEAESIISGRERKSRGEKCWNIHGILPHTRGQFARSYLFLPCMFSKALHYVFIRVSLLLLIIPMVCILLFHTRGITKQTHPYSASIVEKMKKPVTGQVFSVTSCPILCSVMLVRWWFTGQYTLIIPSWRQGGGGNINICTQGRPPHHLFSMPLPEASVSYFCQQLNYCPLTRNFSDAVQWLNEFVSIHGTATQSRFTLEIKHRLWSPPLYRIVQDNCFVKSKGACYIHFMLWNETLMKSGKQHSNGDSYFKKWLKCIVP